MGWKPRLKFRAEPTILSQKRLKDMGSIILLSKMRLGLKNVSKKWMVGKQKKRKLKVSWQKVCFCYCCCLCVVFYFVIVVILALFADLKRNNLFAQECRLVGLKIEREVGKDQTFQSQNQCFYENAGSGNNYFGRGDWRSNEIELSVEGRYEVGSID